jgi:hypothetical protein
MRSSSILVLPIGVFVAAMAGACAPSEKLAETPTGDSSSPSGESDAAEPAANASPEASRPLAETSAPATKDDLQAILQLLIDDDALSQYLHLERPDRFPLRLSGKNLPSDLALTKATQPVVIAADASDDKPRVVITDVQIEGDEASVRYRYDVEKLRGSASFKRRDGRWGLTRSRVTEH